ncbi:MAG: HAD-IB family hydrolase [Acidimicrobiales bacterium]
MSQIAASLAGKRIAITGSTGFLGTALVERLLRGVPDCELVLLVRPGRRSATKRVERDILRNDAFDRLRERHGRDGFQVLAAERIHAVAADISTDGLGLDDAGRELLSSCDVVVHSAAAVSFDEPLDRAAEVNLMGPVRLVRTLQELGVRPHLVAVSTCYVAGSRKGDAPEMPLVASPFYVPIDWRAEVDAARRTRDYVEDDSRRVARLEEFQTAARNELGAAGTPALSAKTEQLRERWVKEQMVDAGRTRAASLGFPDAYAFTKALAEQAMEEIRDDIPLSIVRPSIIESAWAEPRPGWIRGFRMAEPIIMNYGRGTLKEFPGIPEGIIDVIPVDLVAAAIVAVAAESPPEELSIVQVASGGCNPVKISRLTDLIHDYFGKHPIYDDRNQPISPAKWVYPGRGRVVAQLSRAKWTLEAAEKALHKLPVRGKHALVAADLEEKRDEVDKAMGYVTLYGKYVECEALYGVDRLLQLWHSLSDADQEEFAFDPRVIDWETYVYDIHLPSVLSQGRVKTAPSRTPGESRSSRLRKQVLAPERHMAAFDLENTLIASNVVSSYSYLATKRLPPADRARLVGRIIIEAPGLLALDRRDRSDFLRSFYRRYEDAPVDQINQDSMDMFSELILAKSFPAAMRRVRDHREAGHRTVLITGALDFVVEPLRPLFDDIVSASLGVADERYTGQMTMVPPTGETRAAALRAYTEAENLDLAESVAYADSSSDLPMLEAVGFPVAVNPETKLATLARRRGWLIETFEKAPGAPRKLLPLGSARN